jgi:probable rRNA maturation factor
MSLVISKTIKYPLDRSLCRRLCYFVLGDSYDLSLVLIGDRRSQTLNRTWRHKDAPANVLSFSLSAKSGEIYLNPRKASRDSSLFNRNPQQFTLDLFIHGLLHLKGYEHNSTMRNKEAEIRKKFSL